MVTKKEKDHDAYVVRKKAKKKTVRRHRQPKKDENLLDKVTAKKKTARKKVVKKKVVKKNKALPKDLLEKDINSPEFLEAFENLDIPQGCSPSFINAIDTLRKYIKEDLSGSAEEEEEEEAPNPMSKHTRNMYDIAKAKKPGVFTPTNELNDEFFNDLSKSVPGYYSGDEDLFKTLGEETFDKIEKQMADAYLSKLQSKRRMKILKKLLASSFELLDDNLGSILKGEQDNDEADG